MIVKKRTRPKALERIVAPRPGDVIWISNLLYLGEGMCVRMCVRSYTAGSLLTHQANVFDSVVAHGKSVLKRSV